MSNAPLILVPVNGLGNRLRAMAAGLQLSEILKRPFEVLWEPGYGAATQWQDLFQQPGDFRFISPEDAEARGVVFSEIPTYLAESDNLLTLRGYDLGEQAFIKEFVTRAQAVPDRVALIGAGHYFHPSARSDKDLDPLTRPDRIRLLNALNYQWPIVALAMNHRPPNTYIGLHLRGTDRSREAASPHRLIQKTISVSKQRRISRVFLCADDATLRREAVERLRKAGLEVWSDDFPPTRRDVEGETHAIADFLNLRNAHVIVGPRASTFSTEAAVHLTRRNRVLLSRRSSGSTRVDRWIRRRFGETSRIW